MFRTKGVDIEEFKRLNPRDIAGGKKKRKRRVGGGAEAAAPPKGARPEAAGAGAGGFTEADQERIATVRTHSSDL